VEGRSTITCPKITKKQPRERRQKMKVTRLMFIAVPMMLFTASTALVDSNMDNLGTANAQTSHYLSKTDSALELLLLLAEREVQPKLTSELGMAVAGVAATQSVSVSIRFDHELSEAEIADLEALGLIFVYLNGEVAHSETIYGAEIPVGCVDALKDRTDVLRIESTWQPGMQHPLNVSVPEINADDLWQLLDSGGKNITGEGIRVAVFDTGIDVFHPDFWNADGGSYGWIDHNSNGTFDPGTDAVDLNGNGSADSDETLDFFDAEGDAGNVDGMFQADMDWLYNDEDDNGQRNYGADYGFAETDPTYGEPLFIVDDTNTNNTLDVGESLIALGTSKVFATLSASNTAYKRGNDLIWTTRDNTLRGHGTSVCGILNGGLIGRRKYVGVAPNAELLVASNRGDFMAYIPWARANGARVMLYEFGDWTQQFLDGSSNLEQTIDAQAAAGIIQVVPAGNLGNSDRHAQGDVAAGGSTNFTFHVIPGVHSVTITALWRTTGNNLAFKLTQSGLPPIDVPLPATPPSGMSSTTQHGHTIMYGRFDSTRGTAKYDIIIAKSSGIVSVGNWTLRVDNSSGNDEHVDMYIGDDVTIWSGGVVWTSFQSDDNTVTWPATADSAITVASYSTRGGGIPAVPAGELSTSSPAGPRIDGQPIIDIAAPGNEDIASAYSADAQGGALGSYNWFSGTSAAGPHVAAASALLLQWDPTMNHGQIKTMLQQSARKDAFTESPHPTPNDKWGHGKLDILKAVNKPPVCDANGPYTAECESAMTIILLDGTVSSDPNPGDILTHSWTTDCSGGSFDDPTSPTPTLSVDSSVGCFDCTVSLTVTDLAGASDSCSTQVIINDSKAPVITCPADVTIECDEPTDPSNTGTATATDNCDPAPTVTYSDVITPGSCLQEKTITRTWTATDTCGNTSSSVQTIEVVDTTPPDINVSVSPDTLWPPNHKMKEVMPSVQTSDACCADVAVELVGIQMNEGDAENTFDPNFDINADSGFMGDDIQIVDGRIYLRSERAGNSDGRVYTLTYRATDCAGNTSIASGTVTVPHDQS
jgi:subtilisin family serine protease